MQTLVTIQENKTLTTSKLIAAAFEKAHAHVIRDIESLECSANFRQSNFGLSFYEQEMPKGGVKKSPIYHITRDGFTFLAMGYTGKRAAEFKEAYINQFNEMETKIKGLEVDVRFQELANKINSLELVIQQRGVLTVSTIPAADKNNPAFYHVAAYLKMVDKITSNYHSSSIAKYAIQWHKDNRINYRTSTHGNSYLKEALDFAIIKQEARIEEEKQFALNYLRGSKEAQSLKLLDVNEYMIFSAETGSYQVSSIIHMINKWTDLQYDYDLRKHTLSPSIKVTRKK